MVALSGSPGRSGAHVCFLKKHLIARVGSVRWGRGIEDENMRSGVKTQRSMEGIEGDVGVGIDVEEFSGVCSG